MQSYRFANLNLLLFFALLIDITGVVAYYKLPTKESNISMTLAIAQLSSEHHNGCEQAH